MNRRERTASGGDLPDTAAVLRAIERRFRIYGPSVDAAMSVFVPVLEDRDREIVRLRGLLAESSAESS